MSSLGSSYLPEEARPFPAMPASPPGPASPAPSSDTDSYDRDISATYSGRDSTDLSPTPSSTVHPGEGGIFSFPSGGGGGGGGGAGTGEGGGGPVRLTSLNPISPTNEDVYSSEQLRNAPQPHLSTPFVQVLSPRPAGGYPFYLTGHPPMFTMPENEKYRKMMLKKQKRASKKEKNVLTTFKTEEKDGQRGEEDLDSVLESLGETIVDNKKSKGKKSKQNSDKLKVDKKDKRKNAVKNTETDPDAEEETETPERKNSRAEPAVRNQFVDEDLLNFKQNFYLVTPEPHKSRDNLAVMEEAPAAFTKVTSKKHRAKRSREEGRGAGQGAGQQGRESTASPTESLSSQAESTHQVQSTVQSKPAVDTRMSLKIEDFPALEKDDFPALPGGSGRSVAAAGQQSWARVVTKASDNIEVSKGEPSSDIEKDICDANDVIIDVDSGESDKDKTVEVAASGHEVASDDSAVIVSDVPEGIPEPGAGETTELLNCVGAGEAETAECAPDLSSEAEELQQEEIDENVEVLTSEDEFNRRKGRGDNSAPVVILSEQDQDWTSAEFTFGFDVNEDLLSCGGGGGCEAVGAGAGQGASSATTLWSLPAPHPALAPIDSLDGAILSFGGPDPLRPLIVGVPVGVPVPVSGHPAHTIPHLPFYPQYAAVQPFPSYNISAFPHQLNPASEPVSVAGYQQGVVEPELLGEKEVGELAGEDHTVSPESGISSSSPLSWQCGDCAPAPGSPLHSQVSQSLSGWQGHQSDQASSPPSSRAPSPAPAHDPAPADLKEGGEQDLGSLSDSGLASCDSSQHNQSGQKFNLGEIVSFLSSSWSSVSEDSSVAVFSLPGQPLA